MQLPRFVLPSALIFLLAACSGENAEKVASGAVSRAVELAKGTATGVGKGVEDGRKAGPSADGAVIVSNGDELAAALKGGVVQVVPGVPVQVSMGFDNAGEASVRVIDLAVNNHVTALDEEGYACKTLGVDDEFTVPALAKMKVEMAFDCAGKPLATIRLHGVAYAVAPEHIAAKPVIAQ